MPGSLPRKPQSRAKATPNRVKKKRLEESKGVLICIGGLPCAGKTTAGIKLAKFFGPNAILIDPDETRAEVLGRNGESGIGDADLSPSMTAKTIERMLEKAGAALEKSKIVVVPSAFVLEEMREKFESLAQARRASFYRFWLDCPTGILHSRLRERQKQREKGVRDLTTFPAVTNVDVEISGVISWQKIDAAPSPDQIFQNMLKNLPKDLRHEGGLFCSL